LSHPSAGGVPRLDGVKTFRLGPLGRRISEMLHDLNSPIDPVRAHLEKLVRTALVRESTSIQQAAIERVISYAGQINISLDTVNMLLEQGMSVDDVMDIIAKYVDTESAPA